MKPAARVATVSIFLFLLFFNALQVYLIVERIGEAKSKFRNACSSAMLSALSHYHKLNAMDSTSMPTHAWIAYASQEIKAIRQDTQAVILSAPSSSLNYDTVAPVFIDMILNSQAFQTIDLNSFERLFQKALFAKKVSALYRIDTITMTGKRFDRQQIPLKWEQKKTAGYAFSTNPMRMPYNSNIMVFAEVTSDPAFIRNDLWLPLLAFAAILLIGNTALIFVYKTIRKQKKINEVKTDFINNMTHEMKTPITIASAGLDALAHHISPSERTAFYLHTSKKQLHLLNDFVERILNSAVQDIPDYTLKKERLDLHELFRELVQSHSVLPAKPVNFQIIGDGPVIIHGDRLHLETAFHNMIDNAIKYSNRSVDITIAITENTRDSVVKIGDNGMGIPPRYLQDIFEKFFRVPQGDTQSIKGFGLGLYYVSSIVKKHKGTITVHSTPGSGTEFIITLPKNA